MERMTRLILLILGICVWNHRVLAQVPYGCRPVLPRPPIPINRLCARRYEYYGGLATTLDDRRENLCCLHRRYYNIPPHVLYAAIEEVGYENSYYN